MKIRNIKQYHSLLDMELCGYEGNTLLRYKLTLSLKLFEYISLAIRFSAGVFTSLISIHNFLMLWVLSTIHKLIALSWPFSMNCTCNSCCIPCFWSWWAHWLTYVLFGYLAGKFFLYILFMFLTFMYFTFTGMMVISVAPTQHLAAIISSALFSLWNIMSGFIVPKPVSILTSFNTSQNCNCRVCWTRLLEITFYSGKPKYEQFPCGTLYV